MKQKKKKWDFQEFKEFKKKYNSLHAQHPIEEAWYTDYSRIKSETYNLVLPDNTKEKYKSFYELSKRLKKIGGIKLTGAYYYKKTIIGTRTGDMVRIETTSYKKDKLGNLVENFSDKTYVK